MAMTKSYFVLFSLLLGSCANLAGVVEFEDSNPENRVVSESVYDASGGLLGELLSLGIGQANVISPTGFIYQLEADGDFIQDTFAFYDSDDCADDSLIQSSNEAPSPKRAFVFDGEIFIPEEIENGLTVPQADFAYQTSINFNEDVPTCGVNANTLNYGYRLKAATAADLGIPTTITGPIEIR